LWRAVVADHEFFGEVCGNCHGLIVHINDATIANASAFGVAYWHTDCMDKVKYEYWKSQHGIEEDLDE
jgi:hypothetical protein